MLDIRWTTDEPSPAADQLRVVAMREKHDPAEIEAAFGPEVRVAAEQARFAGKASESFRFTRHHEGFLEAVVLLGVGTDPLDSAGVRQLGHDAVKQGEAHGTVRVALDVRGVRLDRLEPTLLGKLLAEGCELGGYAYERFLSEERRKRTAVQAVAVQHASSAPAEGTVRGQIVARSIARARDLANGPSDLVTPTFLAQTAEEIVGELKAEHDVELTVLERADCEQRGMGCYLGVAKGSEQPPKFIHMQYRPRGERRGRVCLLGKGVTFDSGGYSLKPSDGMLDMKMDMAGSAAVLGSFDAIVRLQLPWEVHVIVAATENMVSGGAYKLGDVLTASNGRTVEINNTDAEGRLTLADALIYAKSLQPDLTIDVATLTGAAIVALGPRIGVLMTKDDALAQAWSSAAGRAGEDVWRLPLPEHLKEMLKSKVADMLNTGERAAGAITAGLFLSEFADGMRWMHLDIAGPAMASKAYGVTTPGGTGYPVASLIQFLSDFVPE